MPTQPTLIYITETDFILLCHPVFRCSASVLSEQIYKTITQRIGRLSQPSSHLNSFLKPCETICKYFSFSRRGSVCSISSILSPLIIEIFISFCTVFRLKRIVFFHSMICHFLDERQMETMETMKNL